MLLPCLALARPWWLKDSKASEGEFLPPDDAFRVSSRVDGDLLRVRWDIAEGYYLYRAKFDITAESPGLALEPAQFPPGASRTDVYFGTQEIFQHQVEALVGYRRNDAGAHPIQIKVTYQGCAEAGLCYPLLAKVLSPDSAPPPASSQPLSTALASSGGSADSAASTATSGIATAIPTPPQHGETGTSIPMLVSLIGTAAFFLAGLALRDKSSATL